MPACDARYDVVFNDGSGIAVGHTGSNYAVLDMEEERLPNDWGDPGALLHARLVRWRSNSNVRRIDYDHTFPRQRRLWINGSPRLVHADRRYLRWSLPSNEPAPHDDPECVCPP